MTSHKSLLASQMARLQLYEETLSTIEGQDKGQSLNRRILLQDFRSEKGPLKYYILRQLARYQAWLSLEKVKVNQ